MDRTAFIQDMVDTGSGVDLDPGTYDISDTIEIHGKNGFLFQGIGGVIRSTSSPGRWNGVILRWNGPPDKPMIRISGSSGLVMAGVNLIGKASHGIVLDHNGGNLNLRFQDMGLLEMHTAILTGSQPSERTCANIIYDNCYFNPTHTAVHIRGKWSVRHQLLSPTFSWCQRCIYVEFGGSVQSYGGGSYGSHTFLQLGQPSSNTRGFLIEGADFDGPNTIGRRTQWLGFDDPSDLRTYGPITFKQCQQNKNQKTSDKPLLEVAPGSVVTCEDCGFYPPQLDEGRFAHVWAIDHPRWSNAHGELNVIRGNNLWKRDNYVMLRGNGKGLFRFVDCGSLYGDSWSSSNHPEENGGSTNGSDIEELLRRLSNLEDLAAGQDSRIAALDTRLTDLIQEEIASMRESVSRNEQDIDDFGTQVEQLGDNLRSLEELVRRLGEGETLSLDEIRQVRRVISFMWEIGLLHTLVEVARDELSAQEESEGSAG